MRVLHITHTTRWGAGKALVRHHRALLKAGIDSHLLAAQTELPLSERLHLLDADPSKGLATAFDEFLAQPWLGASPSMRVSQTEFFKSFDVVELRQLHAGQMNGFYNLRALKTMAALKPVVWRLPDAWAFTGFCAYHYNCVKWQNGCEVCPMIGLQTISETLAPRKDVAWLNWRLKRWIYSKCALDVVCPSRWLLNEAKSSIMAQGATRFHHIPVAVDVEMFSTSCREVARRRLNLLENDVVLLVNAPDINVFRKGGDILSDVFSRLKRRNLVLAVIGDQAPSGCEHLFRRIFATGYLHNDAQLADIYKASDVFLFPSRQDNSAQVLLEAAASGLPVVCFDVGGNKECMENKRTGILVPPLDRDMFASAVDTLADNLTLRKEYSAAGKIFADRFTSEQQARAYIRLYQEILERSQYANRRK